MNDIITIDGVKYQRVVEEVKQPTAKYKVGDWVKVIADKTVRPIGHSYVGEIAKITAVYDHGKYYEYSIGKTFVVYEDELEPAEEPRESPFDIAEGERYWWIDFRGEVQNDVAHISDPCLLAANACKNKELMEQRAMHEVLNRLLWRASIEAGELDNPWDGDSYHYIIVYDNKRQEFTTDHYWTLKHDTAYFPTEESAKAAIDNLVKPFMAEHPDFVW